ncbi:hypothetical protein SAMN04489712_11098 [Thermomonospora echinospora]|uniref:DUF4190 domain-containing protein n=1 Tax=Thermomonospora echinospora TaxID=1992 RepID=A0A1H6CK18_9ACTN|nr:DUF4190 domain-containing protein [Thermomonospora echinospora]SEG73341.1 hypothetical protein SAMN04489712_11098 [Thermomonospora echinospora]
MTVPGYQRHYAPVRQRRTGMAVTSLVLGLVGLPTLLLCGLGLPLAMAGLVLGVVAASRNTEGRGIALMGIGVSLVTLLVGALGLFWLLSNAAKCADPDRYPTDADRQHCIEREFPFARPQPTP